MPRSKQPLQDLLEEAFYSKSIQNPWMFIIPQDQLYSNGGNFGLLLLFLGVGVLQ